MRKGTNLVSLRPEIVDLMRDLDAVEERGGFSFKTGDAKDEESDEDAKQEREYASERSAPTLSPRLGGDDPDVNGVFRLLDGERGTGKTVALETIVSRCLQRGWIVLHEPNVYDWHLPKNLVDMGTGTGVGVVPSPTREGMLSQPLESQRILEKIKENYMDVLKTMDQTFEYDHDLYRSKTNSNTLNLIVQRGLHNKTSKYAGDALLDLKKELFAQTKIPVLFAVDQVNTLYFPSHLYSYGKRVDPSNLLLNRTFRCLDPKTSGLDERPAFGSRHRRDDGQASVRVKDRATHKDGKV